MLPEDEIGAVAFAVQQSEARLLTAITEGVVRQEPDMTSRLAEALSIYSESHGSARITLRVVDGIGSRDESEIGADIVGVVRIALRGLRVAKGFLAQAKRSGTQGVHFSPHEGDSEDYSHWLYRGSLQLSPSGIVSITKPSADLLEQCERMLLISPDSFVFVYDRSQIAVVSANAVRELGITKPANTKTRSDLGTKRLDDFFVHLVDSFIGDRRLAAPNTDALHDLAVQNRARLGLLLEVADAEAG